MHGSTRSNRRRPKVQTRIDAFLSHGEKERGGGRRARIFSPSSVSLKSKLLSAEPDRGRFPTSPTAGAGMWSLFVFVAGCSILAGWSGINSFWREVDRFMARPTRKELGRNVSPLLLEDSWTGTIKSYIFESRSGMDSLLLQAVISWLAKKLEASATGTSAVSVREWLKFRISG